MVDVFECGGKCPKGGDHSWDGPGIEWTHPCAHCEGSGRLGDETCPRCKGDGVGGGGGAATCSKCGLDALSDTLMSDPGSFEEEPQAKPTPWDDIKPV